MSASTTPTGRGASTIAPRDAEFMFRVVQNMKSRPSEVNWEKVAIEMGYKNAIVASTRFNQIKKKMESTFETSTSSGSSTESTPSKTPKAKANKVTKAGAKPRTPRKGVAHPVQKGAKSAGKVTKEEDSGDDEKEVGFHEKMEEFDDEKFKYEMEEGNDEQ